MRCSFIQQPAPSPVGWVRDRYPTGRLGFIGYEHSYVAIKKVNRAANKLRQEENQYDWNDARLLMSPKKRSRHVIADVCTAEGELNRYTLSKSRLVSV